MAYSWVCAKARGTGANIVLGVGTMLMGLMISALAVDCGVYWDVHNQLQTVVDSAAIAGAMDLPQGESVAEASALEYAQKNEVRGKTIEADELTFESEGSSFSAIGKVKAYGMLSSLFCQGKADTIQEGGTALNPDVSTAACGMDVTAHAKAKPAARDTMLVIDTSSSMDDLGNGRPMKDVKKAANAFIDQVSAYNSDYVDRIGLVSFNQKGTKQIGLTSEKTSPGFSSVKTKISNLSLFSGTGWNTNYQAGLKLALDELKTNGRKNAQKMVIFMTDGKPNLPAPDSYYSYSQYEPYTKCTDMVDNSTAVKALCTKVNGQKVCPVLPSSKIKDSMISSSAQSCGQTYVDFMTQSVHTLVDQSAIPNAIIIHTVVINDPTSAETSLEILRRLIKKPSWEPDVIDYMASKTQGEQYEAANYDAAAIEDIYEEIAKDIHVKLEQ